MWKDLSENKKNEYKKLILAFASLTEMFAQKSIDDSSKVAPIINSKFQETVFQRAFNAIAEDIGNTSYDASLEFQGAKYLVGIKTFGISSGDQKIAQFKAKHDEWSRIIEKIKNNARNVVDKETIDLLNYDLYEFLAKEIAIIRNKRIDSSKANLKGFKLEIDDNNVYSVYHVLMPSNKGEDARIFVGETSYDKIDIDNIKIIGCTNKNNPTNFFFDDGNHIYKYTSADSQLHMNFDNKNIVCEEWEVKYAPDAYAIFEKISDALHPNKKDDFVNEDSKTNAKLDYISKKEEVAETYCWTIWNKNKEVELFSGFNSFFGTGSKLGTNQRRGRIDRIYDEYKEKVDFRLLSKIKEGLLTFLLKPASSANERAEKVELRSYLINLVNENKYYDLKSDLVKLLYRPTDEMYIPIPDSAQFHKEHPDFFGKEYGKISSESASLNLPKEKRTFNLIFEPSGDILPAYITQDNGKAIESVEKQTYLGEWILRGVFQLEEYEPLTSKKLEELNINGLRFTKYKNSNDIHIEFIWIDEENPPKGFIQRK